DEKNSGPEMERGHGPNLWIKHYIFSSRMLAINFLRQRCSHDFDGRGLIAPNLQRLRSLIKEHPEPVRRATARRPGFLEQTRFSRTIDHIIDRGRAPERKGLFIYRQIILWF